MSELKPNQSQSNVNVTLSPSDPTLGDFAGKEFPCPLCGQGLPIRMSKNNKPYCICNFCGIQIFFRGKVAIARLNKMAITGVLVSGNEEGVSQGINLLRRLERLKLQRKELKRNLGIIFTDENVGNVIRIVDAEIERVEGELAEIARETENENK